MIKKLLVTDPDKRLNIDACLEHPWIKNNTLEEPLPEIKDAIKSFQARKKFKVSFSHSNPTFSDLGLGCDFWCYDG